MQGLLIALIFASFGSASCAKVSPETVQAPFHTEPDLKVSGVRRATGLAAADLNRDGKPDLIMLASNIGKMTVLLQSEGKPLAFRSPMVVDVGASASDLAIADLNEDGAQDIAICHHDTDDIWVFDGVGDGTFRAARKVRLPVIKPHAHRIEIADFNQDKHWDLLLAESDDSRVCVMLGDGKGGFRASAGSPIPTGQHPYVVATGDFNRDGKMDFATPNWFDKSVSVFLGDGVGGFRQAPHSPYSGFAAPTAVATGDLNGDGNLDIVIGNNGDRGLQILVGDGKGGFSLRAMSDLNPIGPCFQPVVADLNGDGKLDVIATSTNGAKTLSYWSNLGGGRMSSASGLSCAQGANTICIADLNGDGMPDVAVGTWDGDQTHIWLGQRHGSS